MDLYTQMTSSRRTATNGNDNNIATAVLLLMEQHQDYRAVSTASASKTVVLLQMQQHPTRWAAANVAVSRPSCCCECSSLTTAVLL